MDAVIGHNWPQAPVSPFSAHKEIYVAHPGEAPVFASHQHPEPQAWAKGGDILTHLSCVLPYSCLALGRRRWRMRQGNFEALDHSSRKSVGLVLLLTSGVLKHNELLRGGPHRREGLKPQGPGNRVLRQWEKPLGRAGRGWRLAFLFYFPRCAEVWAWPSGPARIVTGYNDVN